MKTYTVVAGDTMWNIALKNGIAINELLNANPKITNSALIYPGQSINIPSTSTSGYNVLPGDTMWGIASKNGVTLDKLIAANPQITNSSLIFPGQTINIPSKDTITDTNGEDNDKDGKEDDTVVQADIKALENEVIRLVNIERQKVGRSALKENNEINNIARIKSQDFIDNNYFSHNSPTYGTPFNMLRSFGVNFTAAAENIAGGQETAAKVMDSWMGSSGHRANILSSTYNQIGVGVARDSNGKLYWTQMFVRS